MRQFQFILGLSAILFVGSINSQNAEELLREDCEEAWEYVNYLKSDLKEELESILQNTLFKKNVLLEQTVTEAVEKVLKIRDSVLARTKSIRINDGKIKICPEHNIKQEDFLTLLRMEIMSVLLALIEKDAASQDKLQDIGRQLLAIRTKVNGEITRMLMLRTNNFGRPPTTGDKDCDCGIVTEIANELNKVTDSYQDKDSVNLVDESDDGSGEKDDVEVSESPMDDLTNTLMKVDSEIRRLYNDILAELDDTKREEISKQLFEFKTISTDMHNVLSKIVELDPVDDEDAIKRLIKRDVNSIKTDVERILSKCQEKCPSECESCGSEKILEIEKKLEDYKLNLNELEDKKEALETVRSDLMNYLGSSSSEMTDLLKKKAEAGILETCDAEKLDVINKIKGPLWMMVNITIFGDVATVKEMITALEEALEVMRSGYCGSSKVTPENTGEDLDDCDIQEIETARTWIIDIDTIISENLFKSNTDAARKKAMIGFIDLKSSMDNRVRKLFQNNLRCREEVEQIKNIYGNQLTECLAELMNPRLRFEELDRSTKVRCIKQLRVTIEDRRGELLFREIESKINGPQNYTNNQ